MYLSAEEKAAHLLYFVIKINPFPTATSVRELSCSYVFKDIYNDCLVDKHGQVKITSATLTALTLLVAESDPKEKDVMVALISRLIY